MVWAPSLRTYHRRGSRSRSPAPRPSARSSKSGATACATNLLQSSRNPRPRVSKATCASRLCSIGPRSKCARHQSCTIGSLVAPSISRASCPRQCESSSRARRYLSGASTIWRVRISWAQPLGTNSSDSCRNRLIAAPSGRGTQKRSIRVCRRRTTRCKSQRSSTP